MKYLIIVCLCLAICAGTASGQAGAIRIAIDDTGSYCPGVIDNGGLIQLYFFHVDHGGATLSAWKLDLQGLPWTHLGDSIIGVTIGTTISGISIGYRSCLSAPTYLGFASFIGSNAPSCSIIRFVPCSDCISGKIESVDCDPRNPTKLFPIGEATLINPDPEFCANPACGPVPVNPTTWGAVKALYK